MPKTLPNKAGLSTREKGMVVIVVVAVLLAGVVIYKTMSPDQGHATAKVHIPMDAMPKGKWMQEQKAGQGASTVPGSSSNQSGSGQ